MAVLEETTLVNVDAGGIKSTKPGANNHNKFYRASLNDDGTITKTWGRVGSSGQSQTVRGGRHAFLSLIHSKERRGYSQLDLAEQTKARPTKTTALAVVAHTSLVAGGDAGDPILTALIDQLVASNRHDIAVKTGGLITVDESGVIRTPLGLVSEASIAKARALLDRIEAAADTERVRLLEQFLRLVPQKVSSRAGWGDRFFTPENTIQSQRDLLDQLSDSLAHTAKAHQAAVQKSAGKVDPDDANAFRVKVGVLDRTDPEFARVAALFESSKNAVHRAGHLNVKRIYTLTDTPEAQAAYTAKAAEIRNVKEYWHGTRVMNVLSLLHKGFFIPPVRGSSVTTNGRMFGDGVYFSEQSSKSLGYTDGGRWARGAYSSKFLLLCGVAMGSEYRPSMYGRSGVREAFTGVNKFGKPWNSINVKGGTAHVENHEAIVWDTTQINVRYLLEIQ